MTSEITSTININESSIDSPNRNDLTTTVKNDLSIGEIIIHKMVEHGDLIYVTKSSHIKPGEEWKVDIEAKGAGSNVVLNITMPNQSGWAIIAATPANKSNYFKVQHNKYRYNDAQDAEDAAEKQDKHYDTSETYDEVANGYKAIINITSETHAHCSIVFRDE
ncbi:hypothetical protein EXZ60_17695 [Vibrio sp. 1151_11]|uniref:hypothetical protein n=1 Tax=Vibrio sp. 1151_11 TaxID=2527670 RepID=UPI00240648B3|nr:hypothetical protein [Vibrio sp. 1151_11]MDF9390613.1 hypothetical protein [Vibrio sp. 1151_11]